MSLSEKGAHLRSPHSLDILSNLKLKLLIEADLETEEKYFYAKVIKQSGDSGYHFLIRFTAIPQERSQFSIHYAIHHKGAFQ